MSSPFAIQPAALFRSTAIDPVAFQSLTAAVSSAPLLDSSSSIVELSGVGQVLAAGSSLESSLEALRAGTANPTPGSVLTTAQNFVAAFNRVEQSVVNVLPFVGTLPDNALLTQFAQTLNAAAATATGAGNDGGLQAIGISFQAAPAADLAPGAARLSIDPGALNAAAQADPAGTAALLAQATQPLLQQVALFEAQATSATGLPGELPALGAGVPTSLLQKLPADTLLNNIHLTDLDLAAVGLDSNTLESTRAALASSLSATLAGPAGATGATEVTGANSLTTATGVSPAALIPAIVSAAAPVTPNITGAEAQISLASAPTVTSPELAPSPATSTGETLAADQDAAAARLALRNLLADTALSNVIFDPAYSALIASSHLIDFISPGPLTRASAIPADLPGAVLPLTRARAISSYEEAANGFVRR